MDTFYQRQWLEDLVHTALWEKVISRDENSGPVYDPPREIRCNIQDISLARALSLQERGVNINYEVGVAGDQDINNDDRLDRVLELFKKKHTHLFIVRNKQGKITGILALEDVLEEIVGEIIDEHD